MCMQNDGALADTSVCASTSGTDVHLLRHELTTFKPRLKKKVAIRTFKVTLRLVFIFFGVHRTVSRWSDQHINI